jgi:hypothetical protein
MTWNRRTFIPQQPPPKRADKYRFPSPPLCRFCGAVAFSVGGLLVFYGIASVLDINPDFTSGEGGWELKEIAALLVSLLAGMLFGLIGFGLGASVNVRSENRNHMFAVMWHYLANGSMIWLFLLYLVLIKVLGQPGTKQLFKELGVWYSTLAVLGIGGLGSLCMAAVLLLSGQLKYGRKPRPTTSFLLAIPVSMAMGYSQFRLLNVSTNLWLIIGILFPLALIPFSAIMVARDLRQRSELLSTLRE